MDLKSIENLECYANNILNFTDDEAAEMVKRTVEDMVAGAGRRAASGGES